MALPGDDPLPTSVWGVRLRITPDTSGDNIFKAYTVLYHSLSSGGTYTEIARSQGTAVWTFDHTTTSSTTRQYYKVRTEYPNLTSSVYVGPVDCLPTNLGIDL